MFKYNIREINFKIIILENITLGGFLDLFFMRNNQLTYLIVVEEICYLFI